MSKIKEKAEVAFNLVQSGLSAAQAVKRVKISLGSYYRYKSHFEKEVEENSGHVISNFDVTKPVIDDRLNLIKRLRNSSLSKEDKECLLDVILHH